MKELILATTNQGKLKEIKAMLKDIDIDVLSMKDVLDQEIDIEETVRCKCRRRDRMYGC